MGQAIDLERFRRDLDHARRTAGATWNSLARTAGVSPAMFTRINKGAGLTLDAFARLCAACRLDPADYMPAITKNTDGAVAAPSPRKEPDMNDNGISHSAGIGFETDRSDGHPSLRRDPWSDDLGAPLDASGPDAFQAYTADPWAAMPTPDPAETSGPDAQAGPGLGM